LALDFFLFFLEEDDLDDVMPLDDDSGFFAVDLLPFKNNTATIIVKIPTTIAIDIGCPRKVAETGLLLDSAVLTAMMTIRQLEIDVDYCY
jgi:hypothetical protein